MNKNYKEFVYLKTSKRVRTRYNLIARHFESNNTLKNGTCKENKWQIVSNPDRNLFIELINKLIDETLYNVADIDSKDLNED